jgi:outer membrane protein assembly factor BamB
MPSDDARSRRQVLAGLGGAVGVGAAGGYVLRGRLTPDAAAPAAVAPTDWPHADRGPGNARHAPPVNAPRGGTLDRAWTLRVGDYTRPARPVVANGVVFVADGGRAPRPALRALALRTGEERWRVDAPEGESAGDGLVAAGDRLLRRRWDGDGPVVEARGAADGSFCWGRPRNAGFDPGGGPVVDGDRVYLALSGDGTGAAAGLRLGDGSTAWRTGLGGRVHWSPGVGDGVVVVPVSGGLVAVSADAAGGAGDAELWRVAFPTAGDADDPTDPKGPPLVADGRAFAATYGGHLDAYDLRDGTRLWRRRLEPTGSFARWYDQGAYADETLYVTDSRHDAAADELHARDARDGSLRWRVPASDADDETEFSVPTVCDDLVYVVKRRVTDDAADDALLRLDAATGAVVDAAELAWHPAGGPLVAGGTVLVPTQAGVEAYR